jgi:hypothetical protein
VDTIFKTFRVKATTVSVRLRIYLCALKIPTSFLAIAGETIVVIRQTKFVLVSFLFKLG